MRGLLLMMAMVSIFAANGIGKTYMEQPEYSTGTGANSAYIAVDFDYNNAFVFGYGWDDKMDGTSTLLWDAIYKVAQQGDLNVEYDDYGWGIFLQDIVYPGGIKHSYDLSLWPYWNVFSSQDGCLWENASSGVSEISIQDGYWYSLVWTYAMPNNNWLPERGPGEMPIPEPMTLTLLAFGVGMFTRKKA
jgi:hypothetical protein